MTSTILSYYSKRLNILEVVPKLQPIIISNDRWSSLITPLYSRRQMVQQVAVIKQGVTPQGCA